MANDPNDRFGTPESAFAAAEESHGADNPMPRMGMYVPTRAEVATMPPKDLGQLLDLWMWESPSELIPTREQIDEVRSALAARPDCDDAAIRQLIADCEAYCSS